MSSNIKTQTIRGVIWSSIERFSMQGVQFVLSIIMARLLTPDDYGLIGMILVFMSISQVFIDGGFANALIQKQDRSDADYSTVFYINLGISVLFYLMLYATAPLIASFYNQPLLTDITRVYSITLILNALTAINKTKLVIAVDFKTQTKISFIAALLSGAIGVYCAFTGYGVWSLVIQSISSSIFNILLSYYYVRWFPSWVFSTDSFKRLFAFGSKLLVANLISSVYTNLYTFVIGKKFSTTSLGLYTRADHFAQFASSNLGSILLRVAFPIFSQIQDDDERLIRAYRKYITMSALIVFPLILGLCGVAKPLVLLLLSDKWLDCVILLQILCFSYLWNCIVTININLLNVKGRSDLVLKLEIAKKSVAFTILFISLYFDLIGVCMGLAIYSLIAFYMNTYYTKRLLNYGFRQQFSEILPYLASALFIMGEALLITAYIETPLLSLCTSLIVCSMSYAAICYLFKLEAAMELLKILKLKK